MIGHSRFHDLGLSGKIVFFFHSHFHDLDASGKIDC